MVQLQPQAVALDGVLTHGTNGNPANGELLSLLPLSPVPVVGELKRKPVVSEAPCQLFVLLNLSTESLGSPELARNQAVRVVIFSPWAIVGEVVEELTP